MRLPNRIIELIIAGTLKYTGKSDVYLFGSRTDDKKKGGDIDIAICINIDKSGFRKRKIKFLTYLLQNNCEIKIDIIHLNSANNLLTKEIEETGISLF